MDRQLDIKHINLIGGLVTCNPPKNGQYGEVCAVDTGMWLAKWTVWRGFVWCTIECGWLNGE